VPGAFHKRQGSDRPFYRGLKKDDPGIVSQRPLGGACAWRDGGGKKKLDTERKLYFPEIHRDDLTYLEKLRKYILVKAKLAYDPSDQDERELEELERYFLYHNTPMNFNPYDDTNIIMSNERSFEDICVVLEEQGVQEPKRLTEFEFNSKLQYFEKKFKRMEDGNKK
jgi:hypothetical protein